MNKAISTGGAVGLTAGIFKAAIGVVVMLVAWCGGVITEDQAADVVTVAISLVGVIMHASSSAAAAAGGVPRPRTLPGTNDTGSGLYIPSDPPIMPEGAEVPPKPSNS